MLKTFRRIVDRFLLRNTNVLINSKMNLKELKKILTGLSQLELTEIQNFISSLIEERDSEKILDDELYGIIAGRVIFLPSDNEDD